MINYHARPHQAGSNAERADDALACLLLEKTVEPTEQHIVELVTNLLHLAFARNLSDAERILHAAQMAFIDQIDEE